MSQRDYLNYCAKHGQEAASKKHTFSTNNENLTVGGVERESKLHESIIGFLNSQWPRWKFLHARMDKESTIEVGAHDFTIFMPFGRLLVGECKAKGKNLTVAQRDWKKEMEMLGHIVHVWYCFEEFLSAVNATRELEIKV